MILQADCALLLSSSMCVDSYALPGKFQQVAAPLGGVALMVVHRSSCTPGQDCGRGEHRSDFLFKWHEHTLS